MTQHTPGPINQHHCADGGCPYVGKPSPSACLCHRTTEQLLRSQRDELYEALELHAEWSRREDEGPQYPEGMDRNSSEGKRLREDWFYGNMDLCGRAGKAIIAALAKVRGSA